MKYIKHTEDHPFLYVKGCPSNPYGVVNRLESCGGVVGEEFKTIELVNPHHIFYIDFHDGDKIKYMEDDSIVWETLKTVWKELPPLNVVDQLPESWEEAVDNFYEAKTFEDGENKELDDALTEIGKLVVLRDLYRKGWVPSNDASPCWCIGVHNGDLDIRKTTGWTRMMSFAEESQATLFLNTFEKSLEGIKDYL